MPIATAVASLFALIASADALYVKSQIRLEMHDLENRIRTAALARIEPREVSELARETMRQQIDELRARIAEVERRCQLR